jgi:hypothetical protein
MVRNQGRVTRFVVMAVLQATPAAALGLPRDSAYSWGLNRAIFIAAAKRGFRAPAKGEPGAPTAAHPSDEVYRLGDDEAIRARGSEELLFAIGGETQTVAEFERSVVARFGTQENFAAAWEEARLLVGGFDRAALESRSRFYEEVYRPRRDELSDDWTRRFSPPPKKK